MELFWSANLKLVHVLFSKIYWFRADDLTSKIFVVFIFMKWVNSYQFSNLSQRTCRSAASAFILAWDSSLWWTWDSSSLWFACRIYSMLLIREMLAYKLKVDAFTCFWLMSDDNYTWFSMTITHKRCCCHHITPNAIVDLRVMVYDLFILGGLLLYIFRQAFHVS